MYFNLRDDWSEHETSAGGSTLTTPCGLDSRMRLNAEGAAAPARVFDVRVVELETGAFHGFNVVHLDTIQIQQAGLIDENLQAIESIGFIQHIRGILEGHRIAESRTSAAHHGDPQPAGLGILRVQDLSYLGNGGL